MTRSRRAEYHRAYMREYMRARRAEEKQSWMLETPSGARGRVVLLLKDGRVEVCGGSDAVKEVAEYLHLRGVELLGPRKVGAKAGRTEMMRLRGLMEGATIWGEARPASGTGSRCRRRVPRNG